MLICDFCSDPHPAWWMKAKTIEVPEARAISQGDWAACDQCRQLIERNDRVKLALRWSRSAGARYLVDHGASMPYLMGAAQRMHDYYFDARLPAEPVPINGKVFG